MSRLPLEKKVLSENDRIAGQLRERFQRAPHILLELHQLAGRGEDVTARTHPRTLQPKRASGSVDG